MKVLLDFVHRNDDIIIHTNDEDVQQHSEAGVDGPMQLIRPMPDQLRDYVTTNDYEDFCIHRIDPLLEALYETETRTNQYRSHVGIVLFVFFIGSIAMVVLVPDDLLYSVVGPILFGILCLLFMIGIVVHGNFPGRRLHEAIRQECRDMANRCNNNNRVMNKHTAMSFELVMKHAWRSTGYTMHSGTHNHYDWKARYIRVRIADKNNTDDISNNYQHINWCT